MLCWAQWVKLGFMEAIFNAGYGFSNIKGKGFLQQLRTYKLVEKHSAWDHQPVT
jgi:hypothetical protein